MRVGAIGVTRRLVRLSPVVRCGSRIANANRCGAKGNTGGAVLAENMNRRDDTEDNAAVNEGVSGGVRGAGGGADETDTVGTSGGPGPSAGGPVGTPEGSPGGNTTGSKGGTTGGTIEDLEGSTGLGVDDDTEG